MRAISVALLVVPAALAGCDVLAPDSESNVRIGSASTVSSDPGQYAVRFFDYSNNENLTSAGWTAIVRNAGQPILGDWRARQLVDAIGGVGAVLTDPPTDASDRRALRYDALPTLSPPIEILARFWVPASKNPSGENTRVGVAWFIEDPSGSTELNAMALVRNYLVEDGFSVFRMVDNSQTGIWPGPSDGFSTAGWTWIRIQHEVGPVEGTVRYRAWRGTLGNEPNGWTAEITSTWFGPDGGPPGPGIAGGAGLFTVGDPTMSGDSVVWDVFTIGTGGEAAPPPPEQPCEVFDEAPSDPILADSTVQYLMALLGDASNWDDPRPENRIEVGGHIYMYNGDIGFAPFGYVGTPSPCQNLFTSNLDDLLADSTVAVLGEIHTHPMTSGVMNFTSSDNCIEVMQIGGQAVPAKFTGPYTVMPGPSLPDRADWLSGNPPTWPGFVMSPDSVWRYDAPSQPQGDLVLTSWAFKKGGNACF